MGTNLELEAQALVAVHEKDCQLDVPQGCGLASDIADFARRVRAEALREAAKVVREDRYNGLLGTAREWGVAGMATDTARQHAADRLDALAAEAEVEP